MTSKRNKAAYQPLETLTIDINGSPVPAFSSYFVEARPMIPYSAPPKNNKNGHFILGARDNWFHKMNLYKSNLEWMLQLSHNKFWSQIVYGTDTWDSVISFLQEGYPYYATDELPEDEEIIATYYEIYYLVFNVIKRAMTQKESEVNYIGKKYGSLLYNYTLISVPMMIDICGLYSERFQLETADMISNAFAAQPLYAKDLDNSVQTVKTAFSLVEEQFTGRTLTPGEVTKLSDRTRGAKRLAIPDLQDVVYYLLDISASLTTFLETYKPATLIFHNHKFETNIARLYENCFPSAVQQVQGCCDNDEKMSLYFTLMFKLNHARFFFIKLFRLCIQEALKCMFTKQLGDSDKQPYLDVMSECLPCKVFMKDYHSKFPIDHDLDKIAQDCPDFDNIKYNFLLESLMVCLTEPPKKSNSGHRLGTSYKKPADPSPPEECSLGAVGISPDEKTEDFQSKISEVKDCLPHLGDGFILKCLEHFKMCPSAVINAILEDSLPDEIKSLDTELPIIPPEKDDALYGNFESEGLCEEKRFSVHIGKVQAPERDLKELLDDKSFRKDCSTRFSQLGIIDSFDNVYDDEYDDTYDDSELPVPEIEEPDRKFVVPRVLQRGRRKDEAESQDDEEEGEEEESVEQKHRRAFMNFHENPEDVRARYQEKRHSTMKYPPAPKKDVVGNPKGQGQDNNVLRNRNQKNQQKSGQRKKAAQYKQSKGMF